MRYSVVKCWVVVRRWKDGRMEVSVHGTEEEANREKHNTYAESDEYEAVVEECEFKETN